MINDKKFSLLLGVADGKVLMKNKFNHDTNRVENGLYLCGCNTGSIYNSSDIQQNLKQGRFRFTTGDVVEIEADREKMVITLRNLNKELEEKLKFVEQKGDELYFCISAYGQDTEVAIVYDN